MMKDGVKLFWTLQYKYLQPNKIFHHPQVKLFVSSLIHCQNDRTTLTPFEHQSKDLPHSPGLIFLLYTLLAGPLLRNMIIYVTGRGI